MTGLGIGGILRAAPRIASTSGWRRTSLALVGVAWGCAMLAATASAQSKDIPVRELTDRMGISWNFERADDPNFRKWPQDWRRYTGRGFPQYVTVEIAAHDKELEAQFTALDAAIAQVWPKLQKHAPSLPYPPLITDAMVDHFLWVQLDGGQVRVESYRLAVSRMFQYRFSCDIMTKGLRHDSALAELVFLDDRGKEIGVYPTRRLSGTQDWTRVEVERLSPPIGAASMRVRLSVLRAEDGLEDVRGEVGFDNLRIDQFPQLEVTTNQPQGIYRAGQPVRATARVMGLPQGASKVRFRLFSNSGEQIATRLIPVLPPKKPRNGFTLSPLRLDEGSDLVWHLPKLERGFYRVAASLEGDQTDALATESTFVVIGTLIDGPPHGAFGWTLPDGNRGVEPRDLAPWLVAAGVAWVKYPCWLAPQDNDTAEKTAAIFNKLQSAGVQTIGMLDVPPEEQLPLYNLRGRADRVAAQLFHEAEIWQPQLEPVMTRLTLKVRKWQLGADGDHSFLGRPRLKERIQEITTGLQGFGQPIDVAISWPWMETELAASDSSWQAISRSSDPPLSVEELDTFLTMREQVARGEGPRTWLLLDPIDRSKYSRESRIRDLVLRMATVRSHRVQAAFVADPYDPDRGLLREDGRPEELFLPWRTTSRLLGNLRHVGSLQLRSGAQNAVYAGGERAVLLVWSDQPTEELIFLGDGAQAVDVWGRVTDLPVEEYRGQAVHRVSIGSEPSFIIGADPMLLAFRMSVSLSPAQLDSLLGQSQRLSVSFHNPTRQGLAGQLQLVQPDGWSVEASTRPWEMLGGRGGQHHFDLVLGNSAKIGSYEIPIRFEIQSVPPKRFTVYRPIHIGPAGLELKVTTKLVGGSDLRVRIEMTNRSPHPHTYDCLLFPPPGRQYQRRPSITIQPGETVQRDIFWQRGDELIGQKMFLRAVEQDGRRVVNYEINVTR